MTRYAITISSMLVFAIIPSACNFFEDFDDIEEECPYNSGYPCACDPNSGNCEDGSTCVYFGTDTKEGICSQQCSGAGDNLSCQDTQSYGVSGQCGFFVLVGEEEISHCLVICDVQGAGDPCPPGTECTLSNEGYSGCVPPATVIPSSCECQEGESLCAGTDLNLCADGCHWTTGDCNALCIGIGAAGSMGCGLDAEIGQDNCVCSAACDCATGQFLCAGESINTCDDGCHWTTKDCTAECHAAGYDNFEECQYSAEVQHDLCLCY